MATTLNSPGIVSIERDLTSYVPSNTTSIGAMVGNFRWGPVDTRVLVSDEGGLVSRFGTPSQSMTVDFHSAAYFLRYTNNLYVTRTLHTDTDSESTVVYDANNASASGTSILVKNEDTFNSQSSNFSADSEGINVGAWVAKYPGELGNSLKVSFCPSLAIDSDTTAYDLWDYKNLFDGAPETSAYAGDRGSSNDEIHVVVIDEDGKFTGTPGTVLERFSYVSLAYDAKTADGSTNYIVNRINNNSKYIWFGYFDTDNLAFGSNAGSSASSAVDFTDGVSITPDSDNEIDADVTVSLSGGTDSSTLDAGDYMAGFDLYEDKDQVIIDFLIAPSPTGVSDHNSVTNDLIATAEGLRKDCVVVVSPNRDAVLASIDIAEDTVNCFYNVTKSSYVIQDNNFLKVYDKYNDQYIFIPAASSTAGIMAATDVNAAPFYSPAGVRRGKYLGITSLAYSPNQSERDTLYKVGINSIANIPGQGIILYGDKTGESRASAFNRINVRRLFLMMERAITIAARGVMFEFNDEFTRAEFVNIVEPYLRNIQGRRGIYDFYVQCDETNNTQDIIDNNEFVASIYVKPAKSINYVTLNFVAVRSGASFEEVVGIF